MQTRAIFKGEQTGDSNDSLVEPVCKKQLDGSVECGLDRR